MRNIIKRMNRATNLLAARAYDFRFNFWLDRFERLANYCIAADNEFTNAFGHGMMEGLKDAYREHELTSLFYTKKYVDSLSPSLRATIDILAVAPESIRNGVGPKDVLQLAYDR